MGNFSPVEPGVIALIQQQEDGRIVQIAVTEEQSRILQLLFASMSRETPFVKMGEEYDLILKPKEYCESKNSLIGKDRICVVCKKLVKE